MNTNSREWLDALSSKVIGCAFNVGNSMGCGFLEFSQQSSFLVRHRGEIVGEYIPDLIVGNALIVEVKAIPALSAIHHAQCLNYLRSTGLKVGLLLNFGRPKVEVKRVVMGF